MEIPTGNVPQAEMLVILDDTLPLEVSNIKVTKVSKVRKDMYGNAIIKGVRQHKVAFRDEFE